MVWDPDINPEGLVEQFKHTFSFNVGGGKSPSTAAESYSKDGKTVATATSSEPPAKISIDLFANFGQFVYDDTNPDNPLGPSPSDVPNMDAFMLAWQVGAKVNFPHDYYLQIAPTIYNYTGNGDTFNIDFVGDPTFIDAAGNKVTPNQTGINDLLVLEVPIEFGWKVGELPMKVFGDFAYNFNGAERARAAGHPDQTDQAFAYQVGIQIGKIKEKGTWEAKILLAAR